METLRARLARKPIVVTPGDQTLTAASPTGATASYTVTTHDVVDPAPEFRSRLVTGALDVQVPPAPVGAVLIVTAFGLYYLGSETVRPWMSWIHIAAGISVALSFPVHIFLGRRKLP